MIQKHVDVPTYCFRRKYHHRGIGVVEVGSDPEGLKKKLPATLPEIAMSMDWNIRDDTLWNEISERPIVETVQVISTPDPRTMSSCIDRTRYLEDGV